jgi:hypothetical protein
MVFKLSVAVVALAALAGAANYKRVACPDGKNTATNEAVSRSLSKTQTKADVT